MQKSHYFKGVLYILVFVCAVFYVRNVYAFDEIPPLKPPADSSGRLEVFPIVGPLYHYSGNTYWPENEYVQRSVFEPLNCGYVGWWDNTLEELTHAGVKNILIISRAGVRDNFNWTIKKFLTASANRVGIRNYFKVGLFDDSGSMLNCYKDLVPGSTKINWADYNNIDKILWDYTVKRFFDAVPRDMWLLCHNRPLVVNWDYGSNNVNLTLKNERRALIVLRQKFVERYGVDMFMVVADSWKDVQNGGDIQADARQDWLKGDPSNSGLGFCTYQLNWQGRGDAHSIGVVVPGYMIWDSAGNIRYDLGPEDRDHGNVLRNKLQWGKATNCEFIIHEGWNNQRESTGSFRSIDWDYPNQYINIIREFTDPYTEMRRFQAEACDEFYDTTTGNQGGVFSSRDLDIGIIDPSNGGWSVGWIAAGEWIRWKQVMFDIGNYDIYIRYASTASHNIQFVIETDTNSITLPSTGSMSTYKGLKIASKYLTNAGSNRYDFQVNFLQSGDLNVDYIQFVKTSGRMTIPYIPPSPPPTGSVPEFTTTTINVSADSYVSKNAPTTVYGSSTKLFTNASPNDAYLKFNLGSLSDPNQIYKAYVQIYTYSLTGPSPLCPVGVYGVTDDAWTEASLTYNNAPMSFWDTLGCDWVYGPVVNSWMPFDVTSLVKQQLAGDKVASFVVIANETNVGASYRSREYSSATYAPRLAVQRITNRPPDVNAGSDSFKWLVNGQAIVNLAGQVTDDGFRQPFTVTWSVLSGPGTVIFSPNANSVNVSATFSSTGVYVLQLSAYDGFLTGSAFVTIAVYSDACVAAKSQPDFVLFDGDFNADCVINFIDFALLGDNWLNRYDFNTLATLALNWLQRNSL
jgi:hypothetical protein